MLGIVLDPTVTVNQVENSAGPPVGALSGKVVGIRLDKYWRSWDTLTAEWAKLLEADGATVRWWRHTAPIGKKADEILSGLDQFLRGTDATIVGLCNCGSCTMWTIKESIESLDRGHPTVICATEHFESLARTLAAKSGRDEIRLQVLPYPLEGQDDDYIQEVARNTYTQMLKTWGADS
jgi:hypothetical protein